ncbi:MAG: putative protein YedJ [Candidatus Erwinia impunctatus]|nr:putative protein YedJ [Culicoides impunctatus]
MALENEKSRIQLLSLQDWEIRFKQLLTEIMPQDDKAHNIHHLSRVWANARRIMQQQNQQADELVVLAASYFHDVVNLPKNDPQRHLASYQAAQKTREILQLHFTDFPATLYDAVCHAVHAHSFSAGVTPLTLEAKIVQDADRLESLGAIGIARVFYVSGALQRELFDDEDPLAKHRQLDDSRWSLDHFQKKLLRLPETMQTETGKQLAQQDVHFLVMFMAKLSAELSGIHGQLDESVMADYS